MGFNMFFSHISIPMQETSLSEKHHPSKLVHSVRSEGSSLVSKGQPPGHTPGPA